MNLSSERGEQRNTGISGLYSFARNRVEELIKKSERFRKEVQ